MILPDCFSENWSLDDKVCNLCKHNLACGQNTTINKTDTSDYLDLANFNGLKKVLLLYIKLNETTHEQLYNLIHDLSNCASVTIIELYLKNFYQQNKIVVKDGIITSN